MKKCVILMMAAFITSVIIAQEPISVTCAEAAVAMPAQNGDVTQDVYTVTGYVTNTNGTISRGKQTFWMDDVQGSKKTLEGYWCNLPEAEAEARNPLNVGDKITVTGKILNFYNAPEIKNGDVVILERATVKIDTIEVSVCDALEVGETLNSGDYSDDVFKVFGRVKGTDNVNSYGQHTFEMACGEEILKPYNCSGVEGLELGNEDSVCVIGKLFKFGENIQISNGKVLFIEKGNFEIKVISNNIEWGTTTGGTTALYMEEIEISANANYGYHFKYWDDWNVDNPRIIIVTENKTYTATFAKNVYSIWKNAINGSISGYSQAEYLDNVTLEAIPNEGYHFTQWSDGNTNNPRTFVLTQDTTFTAEFAANTSGQCGNNLVWAYTDGTLTIIGTGAMWDGEPWRGLHEQITQINFPQGITSIGNRAFENCTGLTSVTLPNGVTTIGENAFAYCINLANFTIPKTVNYVGNYAFSGCSNITSFEGPAVALNAIPQNKVRSITINGGLITDFYLSGSLTRLDLKAAENTSLPANLLNGFIDLEELVLPTNLEYIDYMTFAGCLELKGIVIPASVTEIDRRAFEDCRSLSSLTFEDGSQLTTIGSWAFYNCHELAKIDLPDGVREIGKAAFYGCAYAQEVHLPASIRSIGDNGFALCSKIKRIDVDAVLPLEVEEKTFYEVSENAPVYVPDQSVTDYKSHPVWGRLHIQGRSDAPTGVDNTSVSEKATKLLRDGQILIQRGDKTYTITGQEVR